MKHLLASTLALALAVGMAATSASAVVTPDWVSIGNPGNAAQSAANRAHTQATNDGWGAVSYSYRIMRNDVTIAQYTEFLNATAKLAGTSTITINSVVYTLDTYLLWNPYMAIFTNTAGINRNGAGTVEDPYTYTYYITTRTGAGTVEAPYVYTTTVGAGGNRPIAFVNWYAAARFANWIHNGQGAGDTETGAYTLDGLNTGETAPAKNPGARFWVPSENEWFKAGNFDPTKVNADTSVGGYWLLGTMSDTIPTNNNNPGDSKAVNWRSGDWALTPGNNTQDAGMNYLTDVGAYASGGSQSYYGLNDMTGLVWQWNDATGAAGSRSRRGGSWLAGTSSQLYQRRDASTGVTNSVTAEDQYIGFRLASSVLDHFAISAIASPQTVGTPITGITITAQDVNNNTYTDFTGTVTFGGTAGCTGTSASFVAGVLTGVSVTPTVAGDNLTLTVTDGAAPAHTGSTTIASVTSASASVTFDWVPIGNPGNAAKAPGNYAAAWTNIAASVTNNDGVGSVAYTFRMARNKTTIAEYTEFLNLKAKYIATVDPLVYDTYTLDTYRLWNPRMSRVFVAPDPVGEGSQTVGTSAGITRRGAGTEEDPYTYHYYITTRSGAGTVEDPYVYTTTFGAGGNRPVTYVSWFDAARFANWIHNGQGNGDTEDGAYTLNGLFKPVGAPYTFAVPLPNAGAKVRVPTGDEWVKAAYYDPNWGGTGVGGYWLMGNKSNAMPLGNNNVGDPGAFNCRAGDFAITPGNNSQDNNIAYLTDVGAYGTGSQSAYGLNDMAGLTWDWNSNFSDAINSYTTRRQGSYLSADNNSQLYQPRTGGTDNGDLQSTNSAYREDLWCGFRLVSPIVDHFVISPIGSPQTVGTPITGITITAQDYTNATATDFTGTVTFGGTGGFTGTSASFVAGVLSGVSVTPTVAGSNLTFTVTDGASHTGSTTITTIQTRYEDWANGAAFDGDANGDGVKDGIAFLLGAATPATNALGLLPAVSQSGGNLIMEFNCLPTAARGTSILNLQYDGDLVAPWTSVAVPGTVGNTTVGNVSFVATANGDLIHIVATIDDATEAAAGKLFGRLEGAE
jgi:formylglycine-generating enzyme